MKTRVAVGVPADGTGSVDGNGVALRVEVTGVSHRDGRRVSIAFDADRRCVDLRDGTDHRILFSQPAAAITFFDFDRTGLLRWAHVTLTVDSDRHDDADCLAATIAAAVAESHKLRWWQRPVFIAAVWVVAVVVFAIVVAALTANRLPPFGTMEAAGFGVVGAFVVAPIVAGLIHWSWKVGAFVALFVPIGGSVIAWYVDWKY